MNKIVWILLWMSPMFGYAQNYLEQNIVLEQTPATLGAYLEAIEEEGGFYFSYNADLLDTRKELDSPRSKGTVKQLLQSALGKGIHYKVVGSHIILQKAKGGQKVSGFLVEGVISRPDGQKIENVIVYDVNQRKSIVSKGDGQYRMQIKSKQVECAISYSCPGYHDTLIVIKQPGDQQIDIILRPKKAPKPAVPKKPEVQTIDTLILERRPAETLDMSIDNVGLVNVLVPKQALFVSNNLNVYEQRPFQISFLPFVGSNFLSTGLIRNRISINILSGYSAGTDGLEIGGLVNIDKGTMNGVQLGGLANIVGGSMNGLQVGGLANLNMLNTSGSQLAGIANINSGKMHGLQVGGISNFNSYDGIGLQTAGLINSTLGDFSGIQIAGIFNLSDLRKPIPDSEPFMLDYQMQIGGIGNYAKNVTGLQVAGITNVNKDTLTGIQVAGIYNHTKVLRGTQVGLINYVDSLDKGACIGLINIIRNGYHSVQIGSNDIFPINVSLKSGGRHVYTFGKVSFGNYLGLGLGIGATTNPKKRISFYAEVLDQSIFTYDLQYLVYMGDLLHAQAGMQLRLYKQFGISVGPTFNYVYTSIGPNGVPIYFESNRPFNGSNALFDGLVGPNKSWFGWHASLNFQF